ncbi:MAG: ATPase domain-containing protein [Ardenticatenia bacterium]|nr:ATPase domain-containing protein [Ardenticatenia bacterium]
MDRIETGVPNLDLVLGGGIPKNSTFLLGGVPGSGKTVLVNQVAYHYATPQRRALILTTVSEPMARFIRFVQQFSFFDVEKVGTAILYEDLGPALLDRNGETVLHVVQELIMRHQPTLLIVDSFKAIHDLSESKAALRRALYRMAASLATIECTALLVGEYARKELTAAPESTIVDGIVELSTRHVGPYPHRRLQVHKLRGSDYLAGEHSYRIDADGIHLFPRFITPSSPVPYIPARERVPTGIVGLDELLHGGLLRGTTALVVGDPGVGKTVTALHFVLNGAVQAEEPGVYISFQEDPNAFRRMAHNFGFDVEALRAQRLFEMLYTSPVELDMDEQALHTITVVQRLGARRVVVDSIDDLSLYAEHERGRYFEYMYSLIQWFKHNGVTTMLTAHMGQMFGTSLMLTSRGISSIADALLVLRYVQVSAKIRRALTVLSVKGSSHSTEVREYVIREPEGPVVKGPLTGSFSLLDTSAEE